MASLIPELSAGPTVRPEIRGRRGVVSAGKSFAVAAGMRAFARGGNAVDAGVAAVLAAAVTEISHFGFGGECPILVHDGRTGRVVCVPGLGPSPRLARREAFAAQGFIDTNGPRACTVPAVMEAVCTALSEWGTLALEEVMAPAVELARGFPMYETLRRHLVGERAACERYRSTAAAYYPNGAVPEVGAPFAQPDLARTLEELVRAEARARAHGVDRKGGIEAAREAFYKGDIGRRIAAAVEEAGGLLRRDDLESYAPRLEPPVTGSYRGFDIAKCGFFSQGPVLVQALHILEGFDLAGAGMLSANALHLCLESMKLAFDDRDAHYGDPEWNAVPAERLLAKDYAEARRALIDRGRAALEHRPGLGGRMPGGGGGGVRAGDTTAVSAADAGGNLFSAVPSSGWLMGGAFVAGDTGVPMGNRMQSFVLDPKSPNVVHPGKRPRMTLTPTLVLREGKPFLAIGTPGGDSQDQQILNVLVNLVDFHLSLQRAIEAPRFNSEHMQSSFALHADLPGVCTLEEEIGADVRAELERRGHVVQVVGRFAMPTGITAAGIDPHGTLRAGADPRGERYALGD